MNRKKNKEERPVNKQVIEDESGKISMNQLILDDEIASEERETNSIEEFIERKKLQNRILQKMIENINQSENRDQSKTK
jgi:hypothetical protein